MNHEDPAAQADASIDAVVAFDAFHQLKSEPERIDTFMADVARVLKPGGVFVFFERGLLHLLIGVLPSTHVLALCLAGSNSTTTERTLTVDLPVCSQG